jgi:myo-inositol-1(or 4)-monophosphatase
MRLRAFVSSSFAEEDKKLVDTIIKILGEIGFDCKQAKNIPKIPDDAIQMISEYDLFVCILTPRKADQVSPAVSFEVGSAITQNKKLIILREKSVPVQCFYGNNVQIPFDRAALENGDDTHVEEMQTAVQELCDWYGFDLNPDPEIQKRYDFAKNQVQQLGSTILLYFNDVLYRNEIRNRVVKNFQTKVDKQANLIIKHAIEDHRSLTADDKIICEEDINEPDGVCKTIENNEFVWIIDPLDGSLNFAYGFPFFCTSLGLIRRQKPVLGVIYNPISQELFCGQSGRPSECIDLKTGTKRYLELNSTKKDLSDCIVMTHLSSNREARHVTIDLLDQIMERCRGVRMLGCGQMALASLAIGQFDIFFNYRTHIWDIVPGYVILKGAGGYTASSVMNPAVWSWRSRGIVAAANSTIAHAFCEFLRSKIKGDFPTY